MADNNKPMILVYAGPNGSGKSTLTKVLGKVGRYINADDLKVLYNYSDLEAAQKGETLREEALCNREDFTFETVLSSDRNLKLLKRASEAGYFMKCFYVLTSDPCINLKRIKVRVALGGHDVPEDKILKRYYKCLGLLSELVKVCDEIHIFDNSDLPLRIFKKQRDQYLYYDNTDLWSMNDVIELVTGREFRVGGK